ncbi:response regulator transcription factor [Paenibacillus spongiae]|uniref:Response regulator n=1 Tax=Paenibacillus spongiae TaxID=2909671 RepID=A0ABY5SCV3_9BACL|nr:response regulator [Paenibacillus spongiae]UVI31781.1 response regulator [Paenibacillus spongiae]
MIIFLVEDEPWALAELTSLFKVYEPKHQVYAFGNGEDALEAAGKIRPQLVLTDINMPGIDGLELISRLNGIDPSIKGVILSVHEEFAYAQKGVQIGVIDYLLKPAKKDALYKTIDKAIENIEKDTRQKMDQVNWSIAQMLLTSYTVENEISASIFNSKFVMALLYMESGSNCRSWRDTPATNGSIQRHFSFGDIGEQDIHCFDVDPKRKLVLVPFGGENDGRRIESGIAALCQELDRHLLKFHAAYAFKKEREGLDKPYAVLAKRIEDNRKLGVSTISPPDAQPADADVSGVWNKVRVLETLIKNGEMAKGKETIRNILNDLRMKEITVRQLTLFIHDLFYSLKYNLQAFHIGEANMNHLQEDLKMAGEIEGYDELAEWLNEKVWHLFGAAEQKDMKPKCLVPIIIRWIHTHYSSDISLQQFAADNHVSLGYLSRLFKEQTGFTFSEFLIRYRIEKAKQLLSAGVERLTDVSRLVGYEDPRHFSQLFKKIVGEPPISYSKRSK